MKLPSDHTTLTVVYDPMGLFEPGVAYTRGQVALWLADDFLPIGLILRNGRDWTVVDSGDGESLVLTDGRSCLDAQGVRGIGGSGAPMGETRWKVLRALRDLTDEAGMSPTHGEIADVVGVSEQAVKYHLDRLAAYGYVDRVPYMHRAVALTDAAIDLLMGDSE